MRSHRIEVACRQGNDDLINLPGIAVTAGCSDRSSSVGTIKWPSGLLYSTWFARWPTLPRSSLLPGGAAIACQGVLCSADPATTTKIIHGLTAAAAAALLEFQGRNQYKFGRFNFSEWDELPKGEDHAVACD